MIVVPFKVSYNHLKERRPIPPQDGSPVYQGVSQFLGRLSESLSGLGGRSESIWRVLTLRGITALNGSLIQSSQVETTVDLLLKTLRPLTIPSESAELREDLVGIVTDSVTLWKAAWKDEAKLVVERQPDPNHQEKWQSEDMPGLEECDISPASNIDTAGIEPLCLFPSILHRTSLGETVVLQGSALFPSSRVWIHGAREKKMQEKELAKAVFDARSMVNARRISFPPNSPTGVELSTTQT